jgi:hypothetical protein
VTVASPQPFSDTTLAVPLAAWLDAAHALEFSEVRIDVRTLRRIRTHDPVCSIVRGLLGERLRDLRCLTRAPTCDACGEAPRCDYARIFAASATTLTPSIPRRDPPSFWLQGLPATRDLAAGATFTTRIVATGHAVSRLPYLDVALRDALDRLGSSRGTLQPSATSLSASRLGPIPLPPLPTTSSRAWVLETLTPLVLRGNHDACLAACPKAPWLALLARAGVRRLDALLRAFAPGVPRARVLFPPLDDVTILDGALSPWSSSRFSQRQQRRMPVEGLAGRVVLAGNGINALAPLLRLLEVTSVGKATTMGFGNLRIEPRG